MKRRDFVSLFAKVPASLGAATVLSSVHAVEPVIDVITQSRELILPDKQNVDLSDTLLIDRVVSFDIKSDLGVNQHPALDSNNSFFSYDAMHTTIDLECFMYEDLMNRLISSYYQYFQTNVPMTDLVTFGQKQALSSLNGLKFIIAEYEVKANADSLIVASISGIQVASDDAVATFA